MCGTNSLRDVLISTEHRGLASGAGVHDLPRRYRVAGLRTAFRLYGVTLDIVEQRCASKMGRVSCRRATSLIIWAAAT